MDAVAIEKFVRQQRIASDKCVKPKKKHLLPRTARRLRRSVILIVGDSNFTNISWNRRPFLSISGGGATFRDVGDLLRAPPRSHFRPVILGLGINHRPGEGPLSFNTGTASASAYSKEWSLCGIPCCLHWACGACNTADPPPGNG